MPVLPEQCSPPEIVLPSSSTSPLFFSCAPPLISEDWISTFSIPQEAPTMLVNLTPPLIVSPPQGIESSSPSLPRMTQFPPVARTPPLIVELQACNRPPDIRSPPVIVAPSRSQTSPGLTTKPPLIVPLIVPLHSVAAKAPTPRIITKLNTTRTAATRLITNSFFATELSGWKLAEPVPVGGPM